MMEVIVLKYVQLVCITIFMSNNANCAQFMSQSEEMSNFKVAACSANCLSAFPNTNLTMCYKKCANQNLESLVDVVNATEPSHRNASIDLFCRDSERLLIQVDTSDDGHVENEKFIYLLTIQETKISFVDKIVYISDEPRFELHDLKSSESYDISATVVSSNNKFQTLGTKVFTTLKPDFIPEPIKDFEVVRFEPVEGDEPLVNALIYWEPARDQTCLYEVWIHRPENNDTEPMNSKDKADFNLYYHEFKNLTYNKEYSTLVRGINSLNEYLKSEDIWHSFKTPNCMENHTDPSRCRPEKIVGFFAELEHINDQNFKISVTWREPEQKPDFYTLEVRDVDPARNTPGLFTVYKFIIGSNETSIVIEDLEFVGIQAVTVLDAHLNNFTTNSHLLISVPHPRTQSTSEILTFIIFVVIMCCVILPCMFLLCKGRLSKMTNANKQKRMESMELDLIKTITNHSMLQVVADLTRDETMEIERENITLLEKLGEGAFGFVKKAVLVKDGLKRPVAVKMLKDSANIDDIKQFHQEIRVMKSVGQHPNIVSIIGHCTSNIEELMLLTELCDSGSLVDLLRCEYTKQLYFYDKSLTLAPAISCQKHPESLQNFDNEEKETSSYKKFECSSRLFVVNQIYDELNNNNEIEKHQRQAILKAIEMTATNALYLELSDNDSKPVIVEIPEPETPNGFLTGSNLISFAKQVSDGMEFLAQKKVVHRDLAARNILVCSDGTAKIADFGLSRDIYTDNIYTKKGSGKLPIKWLAIESMSHQVYTSKSDVWSFGILLYEIVTLGMQPYPLVDVNQLLKILNTGYRMEKPNHCHHSLYELMMSCWHANPSDRPTFQEITDKLSHFLKLENTWDERFIDLHKLYDKCLSEMDYMKPIA